MSRKSHPLSLSKCLHLDTDGRKEEIEGGKEGNREKKINVKNARKGKE